MVTLKSLEALLDYVRIKAAVSPGDESLLPVLQDPATATARADSALFALTRWDRVSLNDLLAYFGGNSAGLVHFDQFRRVYDVFALIQTMGIAADPLIKATTNAPDGDVVRDFQAALRARYDAADWRAVVQPVNDALRGLQRDALVAYILHQMRSKQDTAHIDTADKLFEHFLMDVQMEPCMQTSRIRHALSSVQLFVERCLMNLEQSVSPASINAKQWEWMKRYRVWEANRKVFLWPENWLEPELRDDKSPFFKEIESELLQSDITEEAATTALLNYLAKLEEVAKLEPCGLYHVEANPSQNKGESDYVIARTAGAHRKYFYRRNEFGYWTPWEQIKLDIEDNPVIPVVWKDRLLLFWLRILQAPRDLDKQISSQGPLVTGSTIEKPLATSLLSEIKTNARKEGEANTIVTVQAVLSWSEYYNGRWQPAKTSDVNHPASLDQFAPGAFERSKLRLSVDELSVDQPSIIARPGDETPTALRVTVSGQGCASFLLYNTHSLPVGINTPSDMGEGKSRSVSVSGPLLTINYDSNFHDLRPITPNAGLPRPVLTHPLGPHIVEPLHPLSDVWDAPFFFADSRHVFFVTTTELSARVPTHDGDYGMFKQVGASQPGEIPPLVVQPAPPGPPKVWSDCGPFSADRSVIDSAPMQHFISKDAYIHHGLGTTSNVKYGDRQIGPSGVISNDSAEE